MPATIFSNLSFALISTPFCFSLAIYSAISLSAPVTSLKYFEYTLAALKEHVYTILNDCEQLTMRAQSYDLDQHPRVPVIVAHNELVFNTFTMTAALLEQMG